MDLNRKHRHCFILLAVLFLHTALPLGAQKVKVDSLARLLEKESSDTGKVRLMWMMARDMNKYDPDSALSIAQQALYLARNSNYAEGESRSLGILANTFMKIGNYPKALELNFQKLQLEEKRKVSYNLASVLMNIGIVYALQEEYRNALQYYSKADSLIKSDSIKSLRFNIALNIGDTYNRLQVADSAYLFFNSSLQYAREEQHTENMGIALTGLGHSYLSLGSYEMAAKHYRDAMQYLSAANNDEIFSEAALGMARLYNKLQRGDSAVFFGKLSLDVARSGKFNGAELQAVDFLAHQFQSLRRIDSAFVYADYLRVLNDSVNGKAKVREMQVITSNEQFRQAEIAESSKQEKRKRAQQLQLLLIAVFIPGIFLLTLILARIRVHPKVVRVLGILSLLFLFEYLTLLLHPVVANLTHHNPLLEILIFVAVAAFIIPVHHKLEHWLIHRLSHWHGPHFHPKATAPVPEQPGSPQKKSPA